MFMVPSVFLPRPPLRCAALRMQLDQVSVWHEEVLWCLADTMGKIFFSSTLLHSECSVGAQRGKAGRQAGEAALIIAPVAFSAWWWWVMGAA